MKCTSINAGQEPCTHDAVIFEFLTSKIEVAHCERHERNLRLMWDRYLEEGKATRSEEEYLFHKLKVSL